MEKIDSPVSEVLVFKTALVSDEDVSRIAILLNADPKILKWNVDREDIDHVLRIESHDMTSSCIIEMLSDAGYFCEELID